MQKIFTLTLICFSLTIFSSQNTSTRKDHADKIKQEILILEQKHKQEYTALKKKQILEINALKAKNLRETSNTKPVKIPENQQPRKRNRP